MDCPCYELRASSYVCPRIPLYLAVDGCYFWNYCLSHDPSKSPFQFNFSHPHTSFKITLLQTTITVNLLFPTSLAADSYLCFILQQKFHKRVSILIDFTLLFLFGKMCEGFFFFIFWEQNNFSQAPMDGYHDDCLLVFGSTYYWKWLFLIKRC